MRIKSVAMINSDQRCDHPPKDLRTLQGNRRETVHFDRIIRTRVAIHKDREIESKS